MNDWADEQHITCPSCGEGLDDCTVCHGTGTVSRAAWRRKVNVEVHFEGLTLYRPDNRCGLACEDRDLLREANNTEGQEEALVQTVIALYPLNPVDQRSLTN